MILYVCFKEKRVQEAQRLLQVNGSRSETVAGEEFRRGR